MESNWRDRRYLRDPDSGAPLACLRLRKSGSRSNPKSIDAVPKSIDAVPKSINAVPKSIDAVPKSIDAVPKSFDAVPKSFDAVPKSFDAVPKSFDAVPKSFDAVPKSFDAVPKSFDAVPKSFDAVLKSFDAVLKSFDAVDAAAGAHGYNADEPIARVEGGQKPMAVILSTTSIAVESMRMGSTIGSIAPGMEADIIAVDGDPLVDITALTRVAFVMKGGKAYKNISK